MLAWLTGIMPAWLASLAASFFNALLGQIRQGVDDARDDQAHEDVGVLKQKQADADATRRAQDEANETALAPRDRSKTIKGLEDGTF